MLCHPSTEKDAAYSVFVQINALQAGFWCGIVLEEWSWPPAFLPDGSESTLIRDPSVFGSSVPPSNLLSAGRSASSSKILQVLLFRHTNNTDKRNDCCSNGFFLFFDEELGVVTLVVDADELVGAQLGEVLGAAFGPSLGEVVLVAALGSVLDDELVGPALTIG
jgi:hypothetical protein